MTYKKKDIVYGDPKPSGNTTGETSSDANKKDKKEETPEEKKKREEEAAAKAAEEQRRKEFEARRKAAEAEELAQYERWKKSGQTYKDEKGNEIDPSSAGDYKSMTAEQYAAYQDWVEWGQYDDWDQNSKENNKFDLDYGKDGDDIYKGEDNKKPIKWNSRPIPESLDFYIPQYGVQDFINERALWQKGTYNLLGEPGWFYFKIFFKFDDFKGLFGGILNNVLPKTSAIRYLAGIRNHYSHAKIMDRMLALAKFTYTLSYINSVSPWFFTGINGVNQLNALDTKEFTKEKYIDLICNSDAIDMRLNTLLDMYRLATWDDIYYREILPENLLKFDMCICIMNVPIKYFQTAIILSGKNSKIGHFTGDKNINKVVDSINNVSSFLTGNTDITTFDYKTMNGKDNVPMNRLSFQMYTLKNCKINEASFANYIPSSLTNVDFFKMGGGAIKINYDRCYKHTFNEWSQMMYGSDGFIYDSEDNYKDINNYNLTGLINHSLYSDLNSINAQNDQNNRINGIKNAVYNSFFNKDTTAYKSLIDFSESIIKDSMINVDNPYYLGNISVDYNSDKWKDVWKKTKKKVSDFFKW